MNILLYIDPGTGSMLFAILIGIIGTLNYLLKNWIVKLRFVMSSGKKVETNADKLPFVIFSDDKRYWNVFEPICREFDRRGVDMVYMTASPDDPAIQNPYKHIKGEFIGKNNKAFAKMNFLNAGIVLSTTPGLDVYQWKRSKDVQYYVHMQHAANDISGYRMFGVDYFDAVLLSGEYQVQEVRDLEKLRGLPAKDLVKIGIPYMDEMAKRLQEAEGIKGAEGYNVLLAPSWGKSSIFQRYGGKIIEVLLKTGYHVIVRPHPQSFTSEKETIEKIMKEYPASDQLEWNRENDNFEVLRRADILISDFSGIIFDFSLVYDKPVIYADTEFDNSPYDAWWLDTPYWTFTALPRIGQKLTLDNFGDLKQIIDECIQDPKYAKGRQEAREETWEYMGEGTQRAVDYLLNKYEGLKRAAGGK
ncbi:MAG: CDP-glycerol--glycerophosphate glycerophosphotransferase [Lachnospiraceae bacterium]|jgi:hypothetical protein|nr:CDP-glycerol--glycerophosphate glycerophosphotransferase [Lachnospiraceae bacterium]